MGGKKGSTPWSKSWEEGGTGVGIVVSIAQIRTLGLGEIPGGQ